MREPTAETDLFGVLAEFNSAERLIGAVKRARAAGYRAIDAYTPFPIRELGPLLDFHDNRVHWFTLFGSLAGLIGSYLLQIYTNLSFPIDIAGRPHLALQAFVPIAFELTVLGAVLACIIGMILLNHLPRLHHPLFSIEAFHLASKDKFFLIIFANDEKFDPDKIQAFLADLQPLQVTPVEQTEEPE